MVRSRLAPGLKPTFTHGRIEYGDVVTRGAGTGHAVSAA
jgi:hypothetical protein